VTDDRTVSSPTGDKLEDRPSAAVIIPSYNDSDRLTPCLEALGNPTIRDRLIITVSLDGGEPLPESIAKLADVVLQGPHAGPAAARNRGWKSANTPYILFTDSDCAPEPDWAEDMIRALEAGADAVKGKYSSGGSRMIQRLAQVEFEERYSLLLASGVTDMVDTYSAGFRRSSLDDMDGFDESFPCADHEDVDLSYRMLEAGYRLVFTPEARVAHVHRPTWMAYFRMKFSRGRWRTVVLRRFPSMIGGGSYTPGGLKVQIILAGLLPFALALCFVWPMIAVLWLTAFLITTIPVAVAASSTDPGTLAAVPLFCLFRGCALFLGMLRGIFSGGKGNE